jgi:hypothetical protein
MKWLGARQVLMAEVISDAPAKSSFVHAGNGATDREV